MKVPEQVTRIGKKMVRWIPVKPGEEVRRSLEHLHPGEKTELLLEEYYAEKWGLALLLAGACLLFGLLLSVTSVRDARITEASLEREEIGGSVKEIALEADLNGRPAQVHVTLHPREPKEEELETLCEDLKVSLERTILGENASPGEIYLPLALPEEVPGYPFSIRWKSSEPALVSAISGEVAAVEAASQVTLTAVFRYGAYERQAQFPLTLVPEPLEERERERRTLESLLREAEAEGAEEPILQLPRSYEGQELSWRLAGDNYGFLFMTGSLFLGILVFFLMDHDLHKQNEERREKMRDRYPEIVRKLSLYMSAGLTVKGAFLRLGKEGKDEPVYDEIRFTCRELKTGRSEAEAYERFGRRTQLQEYIQLMTMLTQNLKKGSIDLPLRLREEAGNAGLQKLREGRRMGEEATTRLLVPMTLMLLVVMIMILLPAFGSMNL